MPVVDLGIPLLALGISAFNVIQYGRYLLDIRRWPFAILAAVPAISFTSSLIQALCLLRLETPSIPCRCGCIAPGVGILLIQVIQAIILLVRMPRGTLGKHYAKRQ